MQLVDYRCDRCGEIVEDLEAGQEFKCNCGGILKRLFTVRKEMQMLPHLNEHLGHEPVYITDYGHFKKELKKRGLYGIPLKKSKGKKYFF